MGNQQPTTINVSTEQGDVVCHKMVFGDYALLLRALDKLPKLVADFIYEKEGKTDFNSQEVLAALPSIMAEALPEVSKVISTATDKDEKFISELDLADVIDVVDGVLTVNDMDRIINSIKKLAALRQKVKPARATKSDSST